MNGDGPQRNGTLQQKDRAKGKTSRVKGAGVVDGEISWIVE